MSPPVAVIVKDIKSVKDDVLVDSPVYVPPLIDWGFVTALSPSFNVVTAAVSIFAFDIEASLINAELR